MDWLQSRSQREMSVRPPATVVLTTLNLSNRGENVMPLGLGQRCCRGTPAFSKGMLRWAKACDRTCSTLHKHAF